MLNPKTIIELDYQFDKSQIDELKKFLDKYFNIYDHEIKIYKVEDYAKQSLFAQNVFDEIQKELEKKMKIQRLKKRIPKKMKLKMSK